MSFSHEVKGELSRKEITKKCCMLAEISGFIRMAGSVKLIGEGKIAISISTENPAIARHYKKLIKNYFNVVGTLEIEDSINPRKVNAHTYSITISPEQKSERILRETGILLIREGNDYIAEGIDYTILKSKCCKKAYLRGAFLATGTISDPLKSYHLEFVMRSEALAKDLKKLTGQFYDLEANIVERNNEYVVYMKKAGYISDFLGIVGADVSLMNFLNIKIERGMKKEAQRLSNCDNANVDRAIMAADKEINDIKKIEENKGLESLPKSLIRVAELRLQYPVASLTEIGEMLEPKIKKAAVSKKFKKIHEIAKET